MLEYGYWGDAPALVAASGSAKGRGFFSILSPCVLCKSFLERGGKSALPGKGSPGCSPNYEAGTGGAPKRFSCCASCGWLLGRCPVAGCAPWRWKRSVSVGWPARRYHRHGQMTRRGGRACGSGRALPAPQPRPRSATNPTKSNAPVSPSRIAQKKGRSTTMRNRYAKPFTVKVRRTSEVRCT